MVSVGSCNESVGKIRFLQIILQVYVSFDSLGGSQFQRNLLCGYTSLGNAYFSYFHILEPKSLPLTRRWVLIKPAQVTAAASALLMPTAALLADSIKGASEWCTSISKQPFACEISIRGWEVKIWCRTHQSTRDSLAFSTNFYTGDFFYHSFIEPINTLVTGFQGKVLVPFLSEWQVAPSAGSWAAQFRLSVCQVSRLVALAYSSTTSDLKERKHNWWQLVVWQPGGLSQAFPKHKSHFWVLRRAEWA